MWGGVWHQFRPVERFQHVLLKAGSVFQRKFTRRDEPSLETAPHASYQHASTANMLSFPPSALTLTLSAAGKITGIRDRQDKHTNDT